MATQLTSAQLAALKTGIQAITNQAVIAAVQDGSDNVITAYCNAKASTSPTYPVVNAWLTNMQPADMDEAMLKAAGKLDALTAGKQFSLGRLNAFARDFRRNAVRSWLIDIWGAVGSAGTSDSFKILSACLEVATRGEVYIANNATKSEGSGGGIVTGLDRSFVGVLNDEDIAAALSGVGGRP